MGEKPIRRDLRPVEHRGDERARLRDEGDVAGQRIGVREARVQAEARRQQADAVRAEHAQQVRPGGVEHRLLLAAPSRPAVMTMAARVPRRPNASINAGTVAGGVQRIARSGTCGRSAGRG